MGGPHWSNGAPSVFNILHSGLYLLSANVLYYPTNRGAQGRGLQIVDGNGNPYAAFSLPGDSSQYYALSCSGMAYLSASSTLALQLYGDSGNSANVGNVYMSLAKLV